jgi:hypothetical protein
VSGEGGKHLSHSSNMKLGSKGGTPKFFGTLLLYFFISYVFISKGGAPLLRE